MSPLAVRAMMAAAGVDTGGGTPATNYALSFDGSSYLRLADTVLADNATVFTIEARVKTSGSANHQTVFVQTPRGGGDVSKHVRVRSDGTVQFDEFPPSGGSLQSSGTVDDNSWHTISIVRDGSSRTIYIDGSSDGSDSSAETYSGTATNICMIGARRIDTSITEYFDGLIDEIRVWTVARTQAQIQANMNNELAGTETGLAYYYNCNALSGLSRLYFDGFAGYVSLGTPAALDVAPPFSIEARVFPLTPDGAVYGGNNSSAQTKHYTRIHEGSFEFDEYPPSGGQLTTSSTEGEEQHIAIVCSASAATLYIDGVQQDNDTSPESYSGSAVDGWYIGKRPNGGPAYFEGFIRDIRIWDDARTPTEIQNNLSSTLTGAEANLVALYLLNEGSGTTATDSAGTADGTISGGLWCETLTDEVAGLEAIAVGVTLAAVA